MRMSIIAYLIIHNCLLVFSNYSFYKVTAFNSRERNWLYKLHETQKEFIFLNGVTNEASTPIEVVVNECCIGDFENKLKRYNIEYSCVASHVTFPVVSTDDNLSSLDVSKEFLNWDDILFWVDIKLKDNAALTKIVIAKTFEQRDIFILKISNSESGKRMAIFIVAGEQGHDWLSSAILLNYIDKILQTASSSDSLLNHYDLYFTPILNPDGFVYSKDQERLWVKNRKEFRPSKTCLNNDIAIGVNIDRNWLVPKLGLIIINSTSSNNFTFQEFHTGSNEAACNSIYLGHNSLSEEETQALSYILNKIALKLFAFINLRGFENLITTPYSSDTELSINHNVMMEIMKHSSTILKLKYNATYPIGTTANYFYNFSGNMADWVKENLNIPVVLTVYMKIDSFLPEPSHIAPLSDHLGSLLNITLTISKNIYGFLYNFGVRNTCTVILIIISVICG